MCILIAIPEPTSNDPSYNQRSLPLYLAALRSAGATPILVPLHEPQDRIAKLLTTVQGVLLPGSRYDVDPQRYSESRVAECGAPDPARTAVDELLLQDAFNLHKPILAICHGAQGLNVWLNGSLVQDLNTEVDHRPGRDIVEAHPVRLAPGSRLAGLLPPSDEATLLIDSNPVDSNPVDLNPVGLNQSGPNSANSSPVDSSLPDSSSPASSPANSTQVNSSHHQAIRVPGDGLLVSAISSGDGVIEAVELDSREHFVVAVQWHPERTYTESAFSRAIFAAFVQATAVWQPRKIEESVAHV